MRKTKLFLSLLLIISTLFLLVGCTQNNMLDVNYQQLAFYLCDDETYGVGVGYANRLSEIVIPNKYYNKNVTKIISQGFKDCTQLKKVICPENLIEIESGAFYNCSVLESIILSSNIEKIGNGAFTYCYNMKPIIIPKSVISIGKFTIPSMIVVFSEALCKPDGWDENWHYHYSDNSSTRNEYWYSETQPTTSGNYWHYINGVVTKW